MTDIRNIFKASLQDPSEKEVVTEGKKRKKKKKQPIKAPHDREGNEHLPPPVKTEEPAPVKAKNRKGKQAQKDKQDLKDYYESEEATVDSLVEDLFSDMDISEGFEFTEEAVKLLKRAYMSGFLSSTNENNGKSCKAIYKNSALQPGASVWNKNLRERFNRFLYNEKKKQKEGK